MGDWNGRLNIFSFCSERHTPEIQCSVLQGQLPTNPTPNSCHVIHVNLWEKMSINLNEKNSRIFFALIYIWIYCPDIEGSTD